MAPAGPRRRVVWLAERPARQGDAWALGCVFYELITLVHPFCLKEDLVLHDILNDAPKKILKKEHDYSWHLRMLPRWLLQKDVKFRPTALDAYYLVTFSFKEYSQPEDGKKWVDEKALPWTADEVNDEDAKLIFGTEGHIQAIDCSTVTWQEVQDRLTLVKTVAPTPAPLDMGNERQAPLPRLGAALITAN